VSGSGISWAMHMQICTSLRTDNHANIPPLSFYHTMHYSAKRGLAIACHLSVCLSVSPSVTLVDQDHVG